MLNTIDVPVVSATFVYDDAETQEIADYIENVSYEAAVEKYGEEATSKAYLATTNTMRLTLAQPIKQEGGYTLVIPSAYFTSGEQFEGVVNKAYEGFFMVKGAAEPTVLNFTTDPENGSTVESLGEVSILFPDYEEDGVGIGNGMITIKRMVNKLTVLTLRLTMFSTTNTTFLLTKQLRVFTPLKFLQVTSSTPMAMNCPPSHLSMALAAQQASRVLALNKLTFQPLPTHWVVYV